MGAGEGMASGKPVAQSSALFIPTAVYPFPAGAGMAWNAICGMATVRSRQVSYGETLYMRLSPLVTSLTSLCYAI